MSNDSPKTRSASSAAKTTATTPRKTTRRRKRNGAVDDTPWMSGRKPELHLHLFEIPVSRVRSGTDYLVMMEGQPGWHRATLEGRAWWVDDRLLGRVVDSALIHPTPERLLHAIEYIAWRLSAPKDAYGSACDRQYYIDRDVIDLGNDLICQPGTEELNSSQQLTIFRHLRLEAASILATPPSLDEIVVGYCLLDEIGNRVFEHVQLEACWLHGKDRKGTWLDRLGVVFADGSVSLGHELAQCDWLE
ncbi:MAG: hypothetical protein AB7L18_11385 [Hyphomicrobiaceae bacterium]